MKWTDGDVRKLAHYLADVNRGVVVYRPRPIIIGPLLDWMGGVLHRALFAGTNSRGP